jgi:hypothetical protein
VVALTAASAGAYYLLGPNKKAHQKKAKILMAKMEKEVMSEMKKAKNVTMSVYHSAVDSISENYAKQYKMHEKDIKAFAQKLKSKWKDASKKVNKKVKSIKK